MGVEKLVHVPAHEHAPAQLQPGLEHEPVPVPVPELEQWLGLELACELEPGPGLDPAVAAVAVVAAAVDADDTVAQLAASVERPYESVQAGCRC